MNTPSPIKLRIFAVITALLCALAACGEAPQSATDSANKRAADQGVNQKEIPVEKIVRDLGGRVVPIMEVNGNGTPTEWTFEASEFKQVEVVKTQIADTAATIVIFMTTRNNAGPDDDSVQVSGRLQLRYAREGGVWRLKTLENLTFRYTVGLAA